LGIALLIGSALGLGTAHGQELTLESWRKDDQIFWDKVLIPAFQRQHPEIKLKFKPEEPLAYDSRLEARLSTRRAGDLIFADPSTPACACKPRVTCCP
jgi:raffinose/stachyose/melibiose transport system substrate-binding protein